MREEAGVSHNMLEHAGLVIRKGKLYIQKVLAERLLRARHCSGHVGCVSVNDKIPAEFTF